MGSGHLNKREGFAKFTLSWYFPFMLLFAAMLIIHLVITPGTKDDTVYITHLANQSAWQYLSGDYHAWSSRQFIEMILIHVIHWKWLWLFCDVALFTLAPFLTSYIAGSHKDARVNWVVCLLALAYPFADVGTAGWVVTTVYYVWTTALCLVAIVPVVKIARGQKLRVWEYPVYTFALLFASNIEPLCAVLLCVYGVFLFLAIRKKQPVVYLITQFGLLVAMLVYMLSCPGNNLRHINEVAGQFPEFDAIPLWRKFEMGYSGTWYEYVMKPNLFFIAFCALVAFAVFALCKKKWARGCALVPIGATVLLGTIAFSNAQMFPSLSLIVDSLTKFGTKLMWGSIKTWVPDIIITIVFACLLVSFFAVFEKTERALLCAFALLMGFGSRMAMSLSPTIWVSGSRTFIYMYFSMIVCAALICREWYSRKGESPLCFANGATLFAIAAMSYLGTLFTIE